MKFDLGHTNAKFVLIALLGALCVLVNAPALADPGRAYGVTTNACASAGQELPHEAGALVGWLNDVDPTSDIVADEKPAEEAPVEVAQANTDTALSTPAGDEGCLACHGDAAFLMANVQAPEAPPEDGCAAAPSRPAFLGSFVNPEFTETVHGKLTCTGCHGGDATATTQEAAHSDMKPAEAICATCHADIAERHETSLHKTLNGMAHALKLRSGDENFEKLQRVWEADCATCHASCADCHLALPAAVGGGLIRGHEIMRRAPVEDSCALCHGSRAGAEFLGQHEGLEPDIHHEMGMHCLDCHKNDMHGDGTLYTNRWQVEGRAQCTDCHEDLPNATVAAHSAFHEDVQCHVCHAQPYQNCFDCHAGETDGAYFRKAGDKQLLLRFGRNTVEGYPDEIVTLRNNPVARDSFDHFGVDLLPDFDAHPTWKTIAPHNIRRVTPQNQSCESCHEDESLFLSADELDPDGAAANSGSVIQDP